MMDPYKVLGVSPTASEEEIKKARGEKTVEIMKEYSDLIMADKLKKIEFFKKYDVYKHGSIKKAVQMLWC